MTTAKKLTPQMAGKLGGLKAGQNKELCRERGRRAAETNMARYGKDYFVRLAMRRHGYNVAVPGSKEHKQKAGATTPTTSTDL